METYYVYMVRCFDGTFYIGVTNDIARRFAEHCAGMDVHCYTYNRRPLRLAYVGEFAEILDAIAFEKQLKGGSHRKKRAFAENAWSDLKRYSRGPDKRRIRSDRPGGVIPSVGLHLDDARHRLREL